MEGNKKCYFQLKENRFNLARRKAGMSYRREQEMLLLPQIDYATWRNVLEKGNWILKKVLKELQMDG